MPIIPVVMKTLTPILITLIGCASGLAGIYFWLTPYSYTHYGGVTVRVHRLNGEAQFLTRDGRWSRYVNERARRAAEAKARAGRERTAAQLTAFMDAIEKGDEAAIKATGDVLPNPE